MKKFNVTRIMSVLQATVISASTKEEAIEKSRKLLQKDWKVLDNQRRKNYEASEVSYPAATAPARPCGSRW